MKIVVVTVRVCGEKEEQYRPTVKRWADSYRKHLTLIPHDLVIINRYADAPDDSLDDLNYTGIRYDGGGWDCGTWLFAARHIPADLLVCFNSSTFIQGPAWLEQFTKAVEQHGKGIYGPLASYEINPHIRTPCMIFQPEVMNAFPQEVNTREDTYRFESCGYPDQTPNVTQWARSQGYQTRLVTWDGSYDMPEWRNAKNAFRKGDQSNLIVHDRHCEAYAVSDEAGKAQLNRQAYGG